MPLNADDRFEQEEWDELVDTAKQGMSLSEQKRFVGDVDHLIRTIRCAGYTQRQETQAIERVEKWLREAVLFGMAVQSRHWKENRPVKK